ncbi:MAG TPA: tRNA dihydrouridine synthase DusB [bacterium]|nr:tRNA dihydrouridine synthase DusB [bacterium]
MSRFPCPGGVALAPLAGIADGVFRRLVKRYHADLMTTEMISATGIVRGDKKTWRMASFPDDERPVTVQLFGHRADELQAAAGLVQERLCPDGIDFNCGCPAHNVVRSGNGSRLMEHPEELEQLVRALRAGTTLPLSVKIRSGWKKLNAVEVAQRCELAGADWLAVHPRTAQQMYTGAADWSVIAAVKRAVRIPVIGNGDIRTGADARRMFDETGCDAVMVGRATLGHPWLLKEIAAVLRGTMWVPAPDEGLQVFIEHTRLNVAAKGGHKGTVEMRKLTAGYTRGLPGAVELRRELNAIDDPDAFVAAIARYRARVRPACCD